MITVAIPTLARPAYALDALRSVVAEACDTPFEVLVLDNGCNSRLAESVDLVARSARVPVVYVPVPAVGLHNARHEAARRARGDVLAYLDDDVVVERGWLNGLASSFSDPGVHLVGGRCLPIYEVDPPSWLETFWTRNGDGTWWCGALTLVDLGPDARDVDPMRVWGANFAIRKATLVQVGGFHPDGFPWRLRRFRGDGETAVSIAVQKLGLRAAYSPDATVRHRVPRERLSQPYFERRAFLQGISDSYTASRAAGGALVPRPTPAGGLRPSLRVLLGKYWAGGRRPRLRLDAGKRMPLETVRSVKHLVRPGKPDPHAAAKEWGRDAYQAGYAYHQQAVRQNPAILEWVLRPDYWGSVVPE